MASKIMFGKKQIHKFSLPVEFEKKNHKDTLFFKKGINPYYSSKIPKK